MTSVLAGGAVKGNAWALPAKAIVSAAARRIFIIVFSVESEAPRQSATVPIKIQIRPRALINRDWVATGQPCNAALNRQSELQDTRVA
jgi:hypothetical protein